MSGAVIGFQIAIVISVWVASQYSKDARDVAIGLWVLETIVFVWFMSPLMFIQFGTIAAMYFLTEEHWQEFIVDMAVMIFWYGMAITIVVGGGFAIYFQINNKTSLTPEQTCTENGNLWEYNDRSNIFECTYLYSLYIETNPKDARVQIMNIKPKYYDGIRLRPGRYNIRVSKKRYYNDNFYIDLEEDSSFRSNLNKR